VEKKKKGRERNGGRLPLEKEKARSRVGNDGRPSDASDVRLEAFPSVIFRTERFDTSVSHTKSKAAF
jgi:hypothetical protein